MSRLRFSLVVCALAFLYPSLARAAEVVVFAQDSRGDYIDFRLHGTTVGGLRRKTGLSQ